MVGRISLVEPEVFLKLAAPPFLCLAVCEFVALCLSPCGTIRFYPCVSPVSFSMAMPAIGWSDPWRSVVLPSSVVKNTMPKHSTACQ
jgi:hypothetical protein